MFYRLNKYEKMFLGAYVLSVLLLSSMLGLPPLRHLIFVILSLIIIYTCGRLFEFKKEYYKALTGLAIFYCSVFFVTLRVDTVVPLSISDYIVHESFAASLAMLIIILSSLINNKVLRSIVVMASICVTAIPIVIIWGYFFSANSFLTVEACMAILQTNPSEAWQYVSDFGSFEGVLGLMLVCGGGYMCAHSVQLCDLKETGWKLWRLVCVLIVLNVAMGYRTRENIVGTLIYDTYVYASQYGNYQKNRQHRIENLASLPNVKNQGEKGVYVLVIGESETRDHMGSYGYYRDNTPVLESMKKEDNMIVFNKAWSCANDTVSALTYALTNKSQYNEFELEKAFSLVEVANAAGYQTVWISNQAQYGLADTPITAIASEAKQQIWLRDKVGHLKDGRYLDIPDYYDDKVVSELENVKYDDKTLIVIHLMGSHNSYNLRYPKEFARFSDGDSYEYDNSILYTDYVLGEILKKCNEIPDFQGLLYFSDHGEGIDAHVGHDNSKFTFQMTRIPMVMYLSNEFVKNRGEDYRILKNNTNNYFTNDLIFEAMMGLMKIDSPDVYNNTNNIMSNSYDNNVERFYTSYGKRRLVDDPACK